MKYHYHMDFYHLTAFRPTNLACLLPSFLACYLASFLPCYLASFLASFLPYSLAILLPSLLASLLPSLLPPLSSIIFHLTVFSFFSFWLLFVVISSPFLFFSPKYFLFFFLSFFSILRSMADSILLQPDDLLKPPWPGI